MSVKGWDLEGLENIDSALLDQGFKTIDIDKVESLEDVKTVLRCLDIRVIPGVVKVDVSHLLED